MERGWGQMVGNQSAGGRWQVEIGTGMRVQAGGGQSQTARRHAQTWDGTEEHMAGGQGTSGRG